jgi:hypothetical protein
MHLPSHHAVLAFVLLAMAGRSVTQPTSAPVSTGSPQALRSIFTDYLDSWTRFVNTTLTSLPASLTPVTSDQRLCLTHLHQLVAAAAQYQPWAMQSKSPQRTMKNTDFEGVLTPGHEGRTLCNHRQPPSFSDFFFFLLPPLYLILSFGTRPNGRSEHTHTVTQDSKCNGIESE